MERKLTKRAADLRESAASEGESIPKLISLVDRIPPRPQITDAKPLGYFLAQQRRLMSWQSVDKDGHRMWERSDGVVAHGYQIEAIERIEKEAHEENLRRMGESRENNPQVTEECSGEVSPLGWFDFVILAVAIIVFGNFLLQYVLQN
jgi:hypothetical protein